MGRLITGPAHAQHSQGSMATSLNRLVSRLNSSKESWTQVKTRTGVTITSKDGHAYKLTASRSGTYVLKSSRGVRLACSRDGSVITSLLTKHLNSMRKVDEVFSRNQQLNAELSRESAARIKAVFKAAQEAVEMPKGFRYTAFRENKSEDTVLSTLMYTSAKLNRTQWVVKSGLMGAFAGESDGMGGIRETDAWNFEPEYDPDGHGSDRGDNIRSSDRVYSFKPDMDSTVPPDKQTSYWLVDILSQMIDDILDNPPNRVYEFFLADGLLRKKNLASMTPGGLIRLIQKDAVTGPEVLKAKPDIWRRLLEKGFVTPEQVLNVLPNQLAWLTIHDYIPVERALKMDPSIRPQLEKRGIEIDDSETNAKTPDELLKAVSEDKLTPRKAWSINPKILKPMVEQELIIPEDAYKLDPSILNWMLENHYIGREAALRLKPGIKREMDRKGVDWETLNSDKHYDTREPVLKGNAHGYQGTYDITGNIDNFPEELLDSTRWVYYRGDLNGEPVFRVEFTMGDVHLFRENYDEFYARIEPLLTKAGFKIVDEASELDSSADVRGKTQLNGEDWEDADYDSDWKLVRTKTFIDPDGWQDEIAWYTDGERHIFMLGGWDPDPQYADWICDSREEAQEWFDDYGNEDLDSSRKLNCSSDEWEYIAERTVDDAGYTHHYTLYGNSDNNRFIITYDDGTQKAVPSEDTAVEEFDSYKEAKTFFNELHSLDSSKKLNCNYEDATRDNFEFALTLIDDGDSAYDDLMGLADEIGYGPDDVGGWGEWFDSLDADQKQTAWSFVSFAYDQELNSSKLNASEEGDYFYVNVNWGDLILKLVYRDNKWREELVYQDEDNPLWFSPASYMGYLSKRDIMRYLKNDFSDEDSTAHVEEISEESVNEFMDEDYWIDPDAEGEADLVSSRALPEVDLNALYALSEKCKVNASTAKEQIQQISCSFNVSKSDAKRLMVEYLGFSKQNLTT